MYAVSALFCTVLYGEKTTLSLYTRLFAQKFVQVFFFFFVNSPTAFLPPTMFPLASRRQAKRATGTSWPDQVALARQLSGLAGTAVSTHTHTHTHMFRDS